MTPAQIHNHLSTLCANAAKALESVPATPTTVDDKGGKAKGKGKGKDGDKGKSNGKDKDKDKDKGKTKAKTDSTAPLTTGNLAKAAGTAGAGNTPATGRSPAGSVHSVNSAKSGATAGGTRTEPRKPPDWYRCHTCQSPKHYRSECPQTASGTQLGPL